jgi:hypothetical protein
MCSTSLFSNISVDGCLGNFCRRAPTRLCANRACMVRKNRESANTAPHPPRHSGRGVVGGRAAGNFLVPAAVFHSAAPQALVQALHGTSRRLWLWCAAVTLHHAASCDHPNVVSSERLRKCRYPPGLRPKSATDRTDEPGVFVASKESMHLVYLHVDCLIRDALYMGDAHHALIHAQPGLAAAPRAVGAATAATAIAAAARHHEITAPLPPSADWATRPA